MRDLLTLLLVMLRITPRIGEDEGQCYIGCFHGAGARKNFVCEKLTCLEASLLQLRRAVSIPPKSCF